MIQRLEFADWVPFPAAQVFKFFSNPENLLRLMPPETQTRIDRLQRIEAPLSPDEGVASAQQAAGVGTVIVTSFRLLPFLPARGRWIARITEFEWNHHFADVQQKGPFRRWHHRHEFLSEARDGISGTLVRDAIEYEVGFGSLGTLANSLFIERQLRYIFAHRQEILPKLLM